MVRIINTETNEIVFEKYCDSGSNIYIPNKYESSILIEILGPVRLFIFNCVFDKEVKIVSKHDSDSEKEFPEIGLPAIRFERTTINSKMLVGSNIPVDVYATQGEIEFFF